MDEKSNENTNKTQDYLKTISRCYRQVDPMDDRANLAALFYLRGAMTNRMERSLLRLTVKINTFLLMQSFVCRKVALFSTA